jgi:hypothetical protein
VPSIRIQCELGKITSPDDDVEVDTSRAEGNSTRWVFFVEQDTRKRQQLRFYLRDFRTGRIRNNMIPSPVPVPMDRNAALAHLRAPLPQGSVQIIELDDVGGVARYRVTVDAVHSLMR